MNNFEKIEAYLEGWLIDAERAAFEAELKEDLQLKQDYEDWLQTDAALKRQFSDNNEESIKQILTPLTQQYFGKEKKETKVIPFKKYLLAITAAAAVLIIYFSIPAGINNYQLPQMSQAVVRGTEDLNSKGAQLFNEGKYSEALPLLEQQIIANKEDVAAKFFYALSLVQTKQFETALPILENLANGLSAYKDDANFFAALSAYKLNKKETAVKYARQVSKENNNYKKAQRILKKME